jgi:hypothetical protein
VLVLGDAFAMPEGLDREAGFPALLEDRLQACLNGPVQVINGGVTGYGPPEELAQARELVPLFRPDAIILEFFVNDWDDLTIDAAARRRGIGLEAGRLTFFDRILRRSQLAARMRTIGGSLTGSIPTRPDWWETRWGLLQFYRPAENRYYTPERIGLMRDSLAQFDSVARAAGAPLYLFNVPAALAVTPPESLAYVPRGWTPDTADLDFALPWNALEQAASGLSRSFALHDLTPMLRYHHPQPVYDRHAWYWNREGHRVAAEEMAGVICRRAEPDRQGRRQGGVGSRQ